MRSPILRKQLRLSESSKILADLLFFNKKTQLTFQIDGHQNALDNRFHVVGLPKALVGRELWIVDTLAVATVGDHAVAIVRSAKYPRMAFKAVLSCAQQTARLLTKIRLHIDVLMRLNGAVYEIVGEIGPRALKCTA